MNEYDDIAYTYLLLKTNHRYRTILSLLIIVKNIENIFVLYFIQVTCWYGFVLVSSGNNIVSRMLQKSLIY